MEELAELVSVSIPDMSTFSSIKPDKCAILQETVNEIRRIKQEGQCHLMQFNWMCVFRAGNRQMCRHIYACVCQCACVYITHRYLYWEVIQHYKLAVDQQAEQSETTRGSRYVYCSLMKYNAMTSGSYLKMALVLKGLPAVMICLVVVAVFSPYVLVHTVCLSDGSV